MMATIAFRQTSTADEPFLVSAFMSGRPELSALPVGLTQLQFHAQRRQFRSSYPSAIEYIITADDEFVGRCIVSRSSLDVRVVDIAVLATHRGRGIGGAVLRNLVRQAAELGVPLRLAVWHANDGAIRLYHRLGLRACSERNGYVEMESASHTAGIA